MEVRAYFDIGGTGARATRPRSGWHSLSGARFGCWTITEAVGQPFEAHINWLRDRGYPIRACVLPHDGGTHDKVYAVTPESTLREAGFPVVVVPNQGRGAALKRIEALRRLFPAIWINEATTEAGIDALGWYHEKRDEERGIGLGPEHDWSSHAADAAGLIAVAHAMHGPGTQTKRATHRPRSVV